MAPELTKSLETFRNEPKNRLNAARTILPLLSVGMSRDEVQALLSTPSAIMWDFALFYSSAMSLWFDKNARLTAVESDLIGEAKLGGSPTDLASPEVAAASAEFKANPYNRRNPAKFIISAIRTGLSSDELSPVLGSPNRSLWRYELTDPPKDALDVSFDMGNKLKKCSLHTL